MGGGEVLVPEVPRQLPVAVRQVQDGLHPGLAQEGVHVGGPVVLVVAGGGGPVQGPRRDVPRRHRPEVGKGLVAGEFLPVVPVVDVPGLLDLQVLPRLRQGHRARVPLGEPRQDKEVVPVVDSRLDVGIAGVGHQQGVPVPGVVAVVVGDVLQRVPVGEGQVHAVPVSEAQGVEVLDGQVQVHPAELLLMEDGQVPGGERLRPGGLPVGGGARAAGGQGEEQQDQGAQPGQGG